MSTGINDSTHCPHKEPEMLLQKKLFLGKHLGPVWSFQLSAGHRCVMKCLSHCLVSRSQACLSDRIRGRDTPGMMGCREAAPLHRSCSLQPCNAAPLCIPQSNDHCQHICGSHVYCSPKTFLGSIIPHTALPVCILHREKLLRSGKECGLKHIFDLS